MGVDADRVIRTCCQERVVEKVVAAAAARHPRTYPHAHTCGADMPASHHSDPRRCPTTPRGVSQSLGADMAFSRGGGKASTICGACVSSDLSKFSQTYSTEMGCKREAIKCYGETVRQG